MVARTRGRARSAQARIEMKSYRIQFVVPEVTTVASVTTHDENIAQWLFDALTKHADVNGVTAPALFKTEEAQLDPSALKR